MSLSRYPEAPDSSARRKYPVRANVVTMTTRVPVRWRLSSAATSRPLMCGISMSVMKTSGLCARTAASASLPLRACATTEMSPSISSKAASAPRTMPWSSASTTRIVLRLVSLTGGFKFVRLLLFWDGFLLGDVFYRHFFERQRDRQSRARFISAIERAAEHLDALPHSAEPIAFHGGETLSVVGDLQPAHAVLLLDPQPAVAGVGMTHHIGHTLADRQRQDALLHRRQLHTCRCITLHREACGLERDR